MLALTQAVRYASRQAKQKWSSAHQLGGEYSLVEPIATYSPWLRDAEFTEIYKHVKANTLVDLYRCYEIWDLAKEAQKLPAGDFLEVGTWRGGTGALMAKRAGSSTTYLCDTFRGVVKAGEKDPIYLGGEHADTSQQTVEDLLRKVGAKAEILTGIFPEDTGHLIENRQFRLCHIDVDVYQGAKDISHWVWPRLVPGGILVYDDYGCLATGGVRDWVDEERSLRHCLVMHNLNGHAVVIKLS